MNDPHEWAAAVRDACLRAAREAHEDAGLRGLCAEGRWEAALDALRALDPASLIEALEVEAVAVEAVAVETVAGGTGMHEPQGPEPARSEATADGTSSSEARERSGAESAAAAGPESRSR